MLIVISKFAYKQIFRIPALLLNKKMNEKCKIIVSDMSFKKSCFLSQNSLFL